MRYEKIRFLGIFVHCNLAIWSITFKFIEYDARPIAISPTSVEQKKFKPGGLRNFSKYFHFQDRILIFDDWM
jgi:hypothetical protein